MDFKIAAKEDFALFLRELTPAGRCELLERAAAARDAHYGREVYTRGLIEFTSYCKNDCFYCGLRCSNRKAQRYRLNRGQILDCCRIGYALGYRTFVLQGGEDPYFTDERLVPIVSDIRVSYPDCAITLSIGERPRLSYKRLFDAGVNRYLLRHETASQAHYRCLHPEKLSLQNRKRCLWDLKDIGYQVGSGFMAGSPGQTEKELAEDLVFLRELEPAMVGIGPFIPHRDTPFRDEPAGDVGLTLTLIAMLRLLLPKALIPATTAVGTLDPRGREKALDAGANVLMPNLSPAAVRDKYLLYDNKLSTGEEAAECRDALSRRVQSAGYVLSASRGDAIDWRNSNVY